MVGQTFGGETATGGLIENYPGHVEVQGGFDLMLSMKEQVQKYEVPVVDARVTEIERRDDCFTARDDEGDAYVAKSVVLAMGRERRTLGLQHEQEWVGQGGVVLLDVRRAAVPAPHRRGGRRRRRGGEGCDAGGAVRPTVST